MADWFHDCSLACQCIIERERLWKKAKGSFFTFIFWRGFVNSFPLATVKVPPIANQCVWWSQNMSTRFLLLSPFRNALVALELKLLSTRLFVYYLLALLLLCHTILKVQFSSKSRFFTFLITHFAQNSIFVQKLCFGKMYLWCLVSVKFNSP